MLALRGHHLAAVSTINPVILQVALRLETFPAVLGELGLAILPWWPSVGSPHILAGRDGDTLRKPSVFSFLGHFSKMLLLSSSPMEDEGGELSAVMLEKYFFASFEYIGA